VPWRISQAASSGFDRTDLNGASLCPTLLFQESLKPGASERGESAGSRKLVEASKDITGIELPPPARKTIDLEGRLVKDGVHTALRDRQDALSELVEAIRKYRKLAEKTPPTLQGSNFAQAVEELNKAIDRADGLMLH
jgi:hypothetical protein